MEGGFRFLVLLVGSFTAFHMNQAQDQEGFISLDCGLVPEDRTYTEKSTNLTYGSDARFIDSGQSGKIKSEYQPRFQQQTWFLRSFPEGRRNCYNLNLTKNGKYLIRGSFVYGNYDGLNRLPKFDLYIGPNKWTSVKIKGILNATIVELIHVLTSDRLQVCLVRTGSTVPFISSLELRPLDNDTYVTQSGSLRLFNRVFLTPNPTAVRFDEDPRDRSWTPHFEKEWNHVSTTHPIDMRNLYVLPQLVMRTGAIPANDSEPLRITWTLPDNPSSYVYMHFAEIQMLRANESRVFNVTYNGGREWYQYLRPLNFSRFTILNQAAVRSENGSYEFVLTKTNNSTHPPLLNAVEIYMVTEFTEFETDNADVDAVTSIKQMYGLNLISWRGDPCSPKQLLWEGLNCSYKNFESPRITSLNLSSSGLTGPIAPYIQDLSQLQVLDLSNNSLTGEIPEFLAKMQTLKAINLSNNNMDGSVPAALAPKVNDGSLKIEGNRVVCPRDLCKSNRNKKSFVVPVVASVASLAFVVAVLSILVILIRRRKIASLAWSDAANVSGNPNIRSEGSALPKDRSFTYSDILKMTKNFQRVLGKGGFGTVYHGYLSDTEEVALKMLSHSSAQGYKQFKAEIELLLRVHHKNLVNLVGYCNDGDHLALIYEYMANGDLKAHLSGRSSSHVMSWADRLRVASDAAQGLEYLHNGCKPPMVHRDVKTTNILLNEHFQAKLADFGLSRSFPTESQSHMSSAAAGTPGYVDPEYYRTNHLSEKSDVHSFGVVLLEVITNQPVIDTTRERPHITEWVSQMLAGGDITKIIDTRLEGNFDINVAWKVVELAMSCVNRSSHRRPSMARVVMELNECLVAEETRIHGSKEMEHSEDSLDVTLSFSSEFPGAR